LKYDYMILRVGCFLQISSAVVKLGRRLNQIESVANLMRLESVDEDGPFFTQLCQSNESKPAMTVMLITTCALICIWWIFLLVFSKLCS